MNPKAGTRIITDQIQELLETLEDRTYSQPLSAFNGSSIGQHIRHIIDFYLCLIRGCEADATNIDYDKRQRNPKIETNTAVAITTLEHIANAVQRMDAHQITTVNSSFTDSQLEGNSRIPSSVGRELMYAYDHAIHHLAIVKIGMRVHFPDIAINPNLGVAPSTLKYRKTIGQPQEQLVTQK